MGQIGNRTDVGDVIGQQKLIRSIFEGKRACKISRVHCSLKVYRLESSSFVPTVLASSNRSQIAMCQQMNAWYQESNFALLLFAP